MLYILKLFIQSCKPDSPRRKVKAIYFKTRKKCTILNVYILKHIYLTGLFNLKVKIKLLKSIYHLKLDT